MNQALFNEDGMKLKLTAGKKVLTATVYDNPTAFAAPLKPDTSGLRRDGESKRRAQKADPDRGRCACRI
mgnify:CR=1 FL=1